MMNQLIRVDDKQKGKSYKYTYDAGGNLISETVTDSNGTTSNAYEYNNSNWGDVLTSYNGQNITYDEIGNPLTYRDGMSMTWKNGRQLATLTNGDTSISYGYDSGSVRTTKTVNGVKYTYAYLNGQLMYETRGDAKFYYSYDANGILYNVRYTLTDGDTEYSYYYTHNSRGDIVGIYNGAGELKAHYEYDAWGNVISITDNNGNAITNPNHIGNLNPFRYRGYYQDTETGLYYLMSRYYDPITHRFINADGYFQSGTSILDANTFAYCGNNPVNLSDPNGEHSSSMKCGAPTCFQCRSDRRDFVNSHIDWYNKVMGTNVDCIGYDGTIYQKPTLNIDFNSTESKAFRSIGIFLECFKFEADVGVGFGVGGNAGIFKVSAYSKSAWAIRASMYDGIDIGTYCGNSISAGAWDAGVSFETASFYSYTENTYKANVGFDGTIGYSKGVYCGIGGSFDISFSYSRCFNELCKLWG